VLLLAGLDPMGQLASMIEKELHDYLHDVVDSQLRHPHVDIYAATSLAA